MPELTVELYGQEVGRLVGADWRRFDFETSGNAIERFGLGSTLLSTSVPLVPFANRSQVARRRNFFAELLPEGDLLTDLAAQARLPEYDVLGLLAHYGRDVADALQIYDPAVPGEPRMPFTTAIDEAAIGAAGTQPRAPRAARLAPRRRPQHGRAGRAAAATSRSPSPGRRRRRRFLGSAGARRSSGRRW